ncbi:class I SAM-dependent methyltransferase [Halopiger goleimassiliensis]|uniref:class I SAM-dependent methyltransferase n=1 Tax=Halopiger goleimassiliensis TaxID=1293048 RepID=UPI0006777432|nr:methyltransferase domain-containing protein [Halopiger goleimassiliensis]
MTTDAEAGRESSDRDTSSPGDSVGVDATDRSEPDGAYEAHLERSRRKWDRWSDWYGMSERDFEPMREDAIDRLEIEPGDRVLDVGCGPGVNLALLREAVGPTGGVVAVDYSPEMVAKARERVDEHGWENVEVVRADATRVAFDEPFDAAIASLSLSVMPDVRRAVENVHRLLVPGAPLVVFDVRPFPSGPARVLNPLVWRFLRWCANWNPDDDVLEALRATFPECEVFETYTAGTTYTALCRAAEPPS